MFESTAYGEAVTQLAVGDRILYYTDGILEVEGSTGEQFGRQNLRRVAEANRVQDVDTLSAFVIDDLITHMAQDTFQDDITLLIAEVVERGEAAAPPTSSPR
jgi:sigma-B regulation protein RsbU (phosphoserine phosphatase)